MTGRSSGHFSSGWAFVMMRRRRRSVFFGWPPIPPGLIVVAGEGTRLLGYAAAQDHGDHLRAGKEGRVARLHDVYVAPDARHTGVGRLLMEAVVRWASTRVRYLQWQAHESESAPFYERLGYRGDPCPQPDYPEFEVTFP